MSQNKCPGCAYESGYRSGLQMDVSLNLPFQNLPNCQHATTQSKDIFAAFAQGYFDGVNDFHQQKTA
ncbi:hypothetical protein [Pleionea sp. CnH1-48]|uniref:hypothetical protein n=1 Tax=Pleionea sp. CnH1-48 TaxID=2954494 RepID=UPI002096FAE1|nr:hypothetical protein [Pleionea sp. CnH1-48]MCO7223680.1 hypothetical protein [Pleionea sp. CnH1-48]